MSFDKDLDFFKQLLLDELVEVVEDDVCVQIKKLLYDLSPYSPDHGVKKGIYEGRISPEALDRYRNNHEVIKQSDGTYQISNNTMNKAAGYNYSDKVEMGWRRKNGTITPGYWVYTQAIHILSKETDYTVTMT